MISKIKIIFGKLYADKSKAYRRTTTIGVVVLVALIGTYVSFISHATTPYVSLNATSGSVAGGAASKSCPGSSGITCVVFNGSGGGGTTMTGCFTAPGKCGYPDPVAANDPGGVSNVGVPAGTNL